MPPKNQSKADLAKKQKIVEDKTFGLKNKNKSKNVQKYVQSLQQAVQPKPDASKIAAKVAFCSFALPLLFLFWKFKLDLGRVLDFVIILKCRSRTAYENSRNNIYTR